MSKRSDLTMIAISFVFVACSGRPASEQVSCSTSDWYELGRRDGASGSPLDRLISHKRQCAGEFNAQSEVVYRNGRNAGLIEYCTSRNGFELGRMKAPYHDVCPSQMEEPFLRSYQNGELARAIELQNQKLAVQIEKLSLQIQHEHFADVVLKNEITERINSLVRARAANESQLEKITSKR
jgi:hypothetical protein